MNMWLHRITHYSSISYPLLKRGWLTMGWLDFAYPELKIIESFHNNGNSVHFLKKKWTDTYPDANPLSTQKINPLAHFLSIQKGDYIVVPLTGRTFTICEALDSAIEIPN